MDEKPLGEAEVIARKLEKIGVDVARRHVFLCADRENPKCADAERAAAWSWASPPTIAASALFRIHV